MRREDAYDGPYVEDAPEIVFDQRPGVHTSGAIGSNPVFADVGHWEAENVRTGLFLADGPAVETTGLDDSVSITDVAPTVLHSVDCPAPTDLDGSVLSLFDDRPVETRDPIPYEEAGSTSNGEVQQRLQDLGYLE
jgi:predicted AlkP superfamily phosphohydrolase/phosphomutase